MKTFLSILLFLVAFQLFAQVNPNSVEVRGYYRSNGTYVQPHHRTAPNSTINDNYSTKPNVNPWTGKVGTITPEPYNSGSYNYTPPTYTPKTPANVTRDPLLSPRDYIPQRNYSLSTTYYVGNSTQRPLTTGLGFGRITLYTDCPDCGNIKIYLNNIYVGTLSKYFAQGKPNCGASGTLVVDKPFGTYKLTAKSSNRWWEETVIIPKDDCLLMGLNKYR